MRHLLLFHTTRAVIKAERLFRRHELSCRVIPVPRTISSECGMSIQVEPEELEKCVSLCADEEIWCKPVTVQ